MKPSQPVSAPPFCYLLLDEQSTRCLALGQVNARAQVAAQRIVDALDNDVELGRPLPKREPARERVG